MVPAVDVEVDVQRKDARAGLIGPHRLTSTRARAFDLNHRLHAARNCIALRFFSTSRRTIPLSIGPVLYGTQVFIAMPNPM